MRVRAWPSEESVAPVRRRLFLEVSIDQAATCLALHRVDELVFVGLVQVFCL